MEWISCNEKLPCKNERFWCEKYDHRHTRDETSDYVLVTVKVKDGYIVSIGRYNYTRKSWVTVVRTDHKVEAWAQLPPPYKEGEHNEKETAQESPDQQGEETYDVVEV